MVRILSFLLTTAVALSLVAAEPSGSAARRRKLDPRLVPLPAAPQASADNPTTPEKAALGKQLFFDKRLSGGNTVSCASCHMPERAFADGIAWNKGETGLTLVRNTQSSLNVG